MKSGSDKVYPLSRLYLRAKYRIEELKKNPDSLKIFILKILLVSFLITATIVTTYTAFNRFSENEYDMFVSRYNSVSKNALTSVVESFDQMTVGIQQLSCNYGQLFPNINDWPNIAWRGFHPTVKLLGKVSNIEGMAILPIIKPEQISSYENYINNYYNYDPYISRSTSFQSKFPNGTIWYADFNIYPPADYPDRYGNTTNSKNNILTPISQYTFSELAGPNLVSYNVHSNPLYTETIDDVIECVTDHIHENPFQICGGVSITNTATAASDANPYPVTTDMVAIYIQPIFPADNSTILTGFALGTISWYKLLSNLFPSDVSGIDCVIETVAQTFTFHISHGIPYFIGLGDYHETSYSQYKHTKSLLKSHSSVTHTIAPAYILNIYPSQEFYNQYQTNSPLRSALIMFSIFAICCTVFCLYDILTQRESNKNHAILETKRKFVRFISHEIRTPLNTVHMGMKLLEMEMNKFNKMIINTNTTTSLSIPTSPTAAGVGVGVVGITTSTTVTSTNEIMKLFRTTLRSWQHLASEIVESSESAVEVLNDLLNYDKIEVGTLKLEFSYFNMRDLVEKTVSTMQAYARQKDINLVLECHWQRILLSTSADEYVVQEELPEEDRTVVADSSRMGQVLRNLISNALKFTPSAGAVTVTVTTSPTCLSLPEKVRVSSPLFQTMLQAGTVCIAVKDSGAGLSSQQLEQICAEGVQFNANELQAGQGSGLGLFISKGIVEQHGGKLTVTSDGIDKGATFTAELPLFRYDWQHRTAERESLVSLQSNKSHASSVDNERNILNLDKAQFEKSLAVSHQLAQNDSHFQAYTSSNKRILVVDDSQFNRKILVRLLCSVGHECREAEDGAVAVRTFTEMDENMQSPDAILMDFEMPVMNGPTATARLREMGCRCLIVGVTGNVLPADVAYFKEHGADAVLPKPLVLEDLETLLNAPHSGGFVRTKAMSLEERTTLPGVSLLSPPAAGGVVRIHPGYELEDV